MTEGCLPPGEPPHPLNAELICVFVCTTFKYDNKKIKEKNVYVHEMSLICPSTYEVMKVSTSGNKLIQLPH